MTRQEAAELLDLGHALPAPTAEMVRARFAAKVKGLHPDSMKLGEKLTDAADRIRALKAARDVLLANAPTDCPNCRGSGWVAEGFRKLRCPKGC